MIQAASQKTIKDQDARLDMTVLIVDDNRFLVDTFQLIMESTGLTVETATSGEEALGKASARMFQLAVIDLHLPDTTGEELSRRLKEITPGMSVMLLTGDVEATDVSAGSDAVLLKPIDPEQLLRLTRLREKNL